MWPRRKTRWELAGEVAEGAVDFLYRVTVELERQNCLSSGLKKLAEGEPLDQKERVAVARHLQQK